MSKELQISVDDVRDLAARIVGNLVVNGVVKDCTDTDDETEFQIQDEIVEQLCQQFNIQQ